MSAKRNTRVGSVLTVKLKRKNPSSAGVRARRVRINLPPAMPGDSLRFELCHGRATLHGSVTTHPLEGGEAEWRKGPVDLFSAERVQCIFAPWAGMQVGMGLRCAAMPARCTNLMPLPVAPSLRSPPLCPGGIEGGGVSSRRLQAAHGVKGAFEALTV